MFSAVTNIYDPPMHLPYSLGAWYTLKKVTVTYFVKSGYRITRGRTLCSQIITPLKLLGYK